jgi:hypothetical protein
LASTLGEKIPFKDKDLEHFNKAIQINILAQQTDKVV